MATAKLQCAGFVAKEQTNTSRKYTYYGHHTGPKLVDKVVDAHNNMVELHLSNGETITEWSSVVLEQL